MSSSSELDDGSGMESVGHIVTCGLPCSLVRNASLYHMGSLGLSCLSLHVDAVDWPLKLYVSAVQMLELVTSGSDSGSV